MAKAMIPVYDICSISKGQDPNQELLAERFGAYLKKHYHNLHRPHRHSFYHLVLFTKGKGWHAIDFNRFEVKSGQVYFMVPGQVHSWHFEKETDGYLIHFTESFFRSFLQSSTYLEQFNFFSGSSESGVCQLPVDIHHKAAALLEAIVKEVEERSDFYADMVRIRLLELFILVERSCVRKRQNKTPQHKLLLLRNFQRLIEQYFRSERLPKAYAGLLYITPNHLNALCQDLLGKTAGEVIRDRVLLEAKRLLTNAEMNISQIAYDLQFKDNAYFNRFFKKYVGVTPEEFRKQLIQP